jgi:hypothetical protein
VAKKSGECFLCDGAGKGRTFTFYSGVRKSGSTTRMTTVTITVLERWRDLRIYEIFVCRDCQLRLWSAHTLWPPIWCAVGAAPLVLMAVACMLLLPLAVGLVVGGMLGLLTMAVGGLAVWFLIRHLARKPQRAALERLVVREAMHDLGEPGHTFITVDQYLDLMRLGIVDT